MAKSLNGKSFMLIAMSTTKYENVIPSPEPESRGKGGGWMRFMDSSLRWNDKLAIFEGIAHAQLH